MEAYSELQKAAFTILIVSTALLIVLSLFAQWHRQKAARFGRSLEKKLSRFPFYKTCLFGAGRHFVSGREVWVDGPYTVVVHDRRGPIALIGFCCEDKIFLVTQLQGIKGANLYGRVLGVYLLSCAEQIARALRMHVIRVPAAHQHPYFYLDDCSELYPQQNAIQTRMVAIYNEAPRKLGYETELQFKSHRVWRRKVLRKPITLSRAFRFHLILFNRQARRIAPFARDVKSY